MGARLFHHPLTKPSYLLPFFLQILHWTNSNHPLLEFTSQTDCLTSDFRVSVKEVSRLIHDLESSKATGPDEVPVVVLKNISPEISPILSRLFNRCLKEKCFPTSSKTSSICPVFKNSGDCSSPSQYRPNSLLSKYQQAS